MRTLQWCHFGMNDFNGMIRLNRPMPSDTLSSAAAAVRLGVGVSAVKRWADAGLLPCVKTAGGHRRFHVRDVERFRAGDATDDPWRAWLEPLIESVNVHGVLALLFAERARRASWSGVATQVGALLVEIGERWSRQELTVVQEHVASSTLARGLALAAETLPVGSTAPACLLATADGDNHTLALSLAELCLREAGWRTEWAGSHTRPADICERVGGGTVRMVALSASAFSRDRRALRAQERLVGSACHRAGIPLFLGGAGRWPDAPAFGTVIRDWQEFSAVLRRTPGGAGRGRS
jgi:MerR family transcriptional regulator, light-induced transcriptional regulator